MITNLSELEENILYRYEKALKNFEDEFNFHMSVIVNEVLKEVEPVSIYLIGSFGRNEGSLFLSNDVISPIRDYDILLIVNKHINKTVLNELSININNILGFDNPNLKKYKFKGFITWITQAKLIDINHLPFLKYYEIKENSILLWGKDIRNKINISIHDLTIYNGIIILFSKIETLLGLLDINTLRARTNDQEETIDLIYECMKIYVEFGTCLSVLIKSYEPSFLKRCTLISKNLQKTFPELYYINNNLGNLMVTYAYKRLLIEPDFIDSINLGQLLTESQRDLRVVIWYYVYKAYKIKFKSEPTSIYLFDEYINKLNTIILYDFIDHYIKSKIGFSLKIMSETAIRMYLRYSLFVFWLESRKSGFNTKLGIIFSKNSNIMIRLWSLSFMLLGCIKEDLQIDTEILDHVYEKFSEIIDYDIIQKKSFNEPELKFTYLQHNAVKLLGIADKIFHRKD